MPSLRLVEPPSPAPGINATVGERSVGPLAIEAAPATAATTGEGNSDHTLEIQGKGTEQAGLMTKVFRHWASSGGA